MNGQIVISTSDGFTSTFSIGITKYTPISTVPAGVPSSDFYYVEIYDSGFIKHMLYNYYWRKDPGKYLQEYWGEQSPHYWRRYICIPSENKLGIIGPAEPGKPENLEVTWLNASETSSITVNAGEDLWLTDRAYEQELALWKMVSILALIAGLAIMYIITAVVKKKIATIRGRVSAPPSS